MLQGDCPWSDIVEAHGRNQCRCDSFAYYQASRRALADEVSVIVSINLSGARKHLISPLPLYLSSIDEGRLSTTGLGWQRRYLLQYLAVMRITYGSLLLRHVHPGTRGTTRSDTPTDVALLSGVGHAQKENISKHAQIHVNSEDTASR